MPNCSFPPDIALAADAPVFIATAEAGLDHQDRHGVTVSMAQWPGGIGEEPLFDTAG